MGSAATLSRWAVIVVVACGSTEADSDATAVGDSGSGGAPESADADGANGGSDASASDVGATENDAGMRDAVPEAPGPTRPYALASAGAQLLLVPAPGIRLTSPDLGSDVDVPLVHQEFYGLPWDAFETGAAPPAPWVAAMDDLVARARAVGPIFLSLQLVSGRGRRFLADRAVIASGVLANPESGWSAECYDFATAPDGASKRAAYAAYVDWMVRRFRPRWVNVAIEMNQFMSCGDGPWAALVDVERAAYDAAKAADPAVIAFPSIQIDVLLGYAPDCTLPNRDDCFDASYGRLANVKRDRFAVTSFPYLIEALRDPAKLPSDWFTRAGDRGRERTVVAETGWLATPMVVRLGSQCVSAIPSSEDAQLAWFDRVTSAARASKMDLVTWVANRDLVPAALMTDCPCDFDPQWCGFLDAFRQSVGGSSPDNQASAEYGIKQFGSMGLRQYDGAARTALYARWQTARALPWAGAP
jgi:hypothetical protein